MCELPSLFHFKTQKWTKLASKVDPGSLLQNVDQVAYTKEYALGTCEQFSTFQTCHALIHMHPCTISGISFLVFFITVGVIALAEVLAESRIIIVHACWLRTILQGLLDENYNCMVLRGSVYWLHMTTCM